MFGSNYPQELNRTGNTLAKIKEKIRSELADHEKYPIYRYDNYPLNWDLIPFADGYKFYAISGVSKGRAIPFGNDYLFIANKKEKFNRGRNFIPDLFRWKLQNKCR